MGLFCIVRAQATGRDDMLRAYPLAESDTLTTTRRVYCPLLDRPVTLTVERLPLLLSEIGSSRSWSQTEVDCDQWESCPSGGSEACLRRIAERKFNSESLLRAKHAAMSPSSHLRGSEPRDVSTMSLVCPSSHLCGSEPAQTVKFIASNLQATYAVANSVMGSIGCS